METNGNSSPTANTSVGILDAEEYRKNPIFLLSRLKFEVE